MQRCILAKLQCFSVAKLHSCIVAKLQSCNVALFFLFLLLFWQGKTKSNPTLTCPKSFTKSISFLPHERNKEYKSFTPKNKQKGGPVKPLIVIYIFFGGKSNKSLKTWVWHCSYTTLQKIQSYSCNVFYQKFSANMFDYIELKMWKSTNIKMGDFSLLKKKAKSLTKTYQKEINYKPEFWERGLLMKDNLWSKVAFDKRFVWWKTAFDGRQPLMKYDSVR